MLIRITNKCTMGCSHCMIDASSPDGEHMPMAVFKKALSFARDAGSLGLILSGGEPFEHPQLEEMVALAQKTAAVTIIATNGLFTLDSEKLELAKRMSAFIQVTNDPRYYPKRIDESKLKDMPNVSVESTIRIMYGCKRSRAAGYEPTRLSPFCFNVRSASRKLGFSAAISILERAGKFCSPSINADGTIVAGEADTCYGLGNVREDSVSDVDRRIRGMNECNRCGLMNNLGDEHIDAIGERTWR